MKIIKVSNSPPRPDKIFRLYLTRSHLSILCALSDIRNQLLLLSFELLPLAVEFTLGFFKGALVLDDGWEVGQ